MSNVVNLHGEKRWRAVIEYAHGNGPVTIEHFFEELGELQQIVEHGPDLNTLARCTLTTCRQMLPPEQPASKLGHHPEGP